MRLRSLRIKAKSADQQLGASRRLRNAAEDFQRNWPKARPLLPAPWPPCTNIGVCSCVLVTTSRSFAAVVSAAAGFPEHDIGTGDLSTGHQISPLMWAGHVLACRLSPHVPLCRARLDARAVLTCCGMWAAQVLTCVVLFYAFSSGIAWRVLHFFWIVSWLAPLLLLPVLSRLNRRVCTALGMHRSSCTRALYMECNSPGRLAIMQSQLDNTICWPLRALDSCRQSLCERGCVSSCVDLSTAGGSGPGRCTGSCSSATAAAAAAASWSAAFRRVEPLWHLRQARRRLRSPATGPSDRCRVGDDRRRRSLALAHILPPPRSCLCGVLLAICADPAIVLCTTVYQSKMMIAACA